MTIQQWFYLKIDQKLTAKRLIQNWQERNMFRIRNMKILTKSNKYSVKEMKKTVRRKLPNFYNVAIKLSNIKNLGMIRSLINTQFDIFKYCTKFYVVVI